MKAKEKKLLARANTINVICMEFWEICHHFPVMNPSKWILLSLRKTKTHNKIHHIFEYIACKHTKQYNSDKMNTHNCETECKTMRKSITQWFSRLSIMFYIREILHQENNNNNNIKCTICIKYKQFALFPICL